MPEVWLVTNYEEAPTKKEGEVNLGTATAPEGFDSPFTGKKVEDAAQWLKNKPDTVDLDPHHFAILEQGAKGQKMSIVVCKIGDRSLKGDTLDCLRHDANFAASFLLGIDAGEWENWSADGKNRAKIDYGDSD